MSKKSLLKKYNGNVDHWKQWLILYEKGYRSVNGNFNCSCNGLTSLRYCPEKITNGYFDCGNNKLKSLEYAPSYIDGEFFCNYNEL